MPFSRLQPETAEAKKAEKDFANKLKCLGHKQWENENGNSRCGRKDQKKNHGESLLALQVKQQTRIPFFALVRFETKIDSNLIIDCRVLSVREPFLHTLKIPFLSMARNEIELKCLEVPWRCYFVLSLVPSHSLASRARFSNQFRCRQPSVSVPNSLNLRAFLSYLSNPLENKMSPSVSCRKVSNEIIIRTRKVLQEKLS